MGQQQLTDRRRGAWHVELDGGRAHSLAFLFIRGVICLWLNGLGSVYTWLSRVKGKVDRGSNNRLTSLVLRCANTPKDMKLQMPRCRQTFLQGSWIRLD